MTRSRPSPYRAVLCTAVLSLLALSSCHTSDIAGNAARNLVGGRGGDLAGAFAQSAVELGDQMSVQFSPEQEYFLGRGVAAFAIATYGLDPDEGRQAYVQKIGAALVSLAPRVRTTYGGYHFAVLNGAQPNGLSGPGGFIFVTRGALDLARSEDEVAGILAHEISHVSLQHGEALIRQSQYWQTQMKGFARVGVAAAGGRGHDASKMVTIFGETVSGFTKQLASTGYGPELEYKADLEGTYILYDAGYDAGSIVQYLKTLPDRPHTAWSAHPESPDRIRRLEAVVKQYGGSFDGGAGEAARKPRFDAVMGRKP